MRRQAKAEYDIKPRATARWSCPRVGGAGGGRPFFIVHSQLTQSPEPPPPVLRPRTPQTTSTPFYRPKNTLVHPAHTPHPCTHPCTHPTTHRRTPTPRHTTYSPTPPPLTEIEPLQITCSHVCDDLLLSDLTPTTVVLPMCSAHSACFPNPPPGRPKQPGVYLVGAQRLHRRLNIRLFRGRKRVYINTG